MTDFESQISVMLHEVVPEPRRELDPAVVTAVSAPRRHYRLLAAVGAVAAVAGIAVVAVVVRQSPHHVVGSPVGPSSTDTTPTSDPSVLYGPTWTLTAIHGLAGTADATPDAAITFRFADHAGAPGRSQITSGRCGSAPADIRPGVMVIHQPFVVATPTDCGSQLGTAQNNFVFDLLSGTVSWAVTANRLTINHAGVGSLDLTADAAPMPKTPIVVGLTAGMALTRLHAAGLYVIQFTARRSDMKAGTVLAQTPSADSPTPPGAQVTLDVSAGPKAALHQLVGVPGIGTCDMGPPPPSSTSCLGGPLMVRVTK